MPDPMTSSRGRRLCWNHAVVTKVATAMNVEIWSDVVCPWCYIGKRRFERAIASFGHPGEVTVTYRSFELDPDAPAQRTGTQAEHLARKYGMTVAQAEQANQQMTERAAADGLDFRFDLIRGGNTFDAHRLLHLANDHGLQPENEGAPAARHLHRRSADRLDLVRWPTERQPRSAVLDGDACRRGASRRARPRDASPACRSSSPTASTRSGAAAVLLQLLQRARA